MKLTQYLEQIHLDIPMLVMVLLAIVSSVAVIYFKHLNRNEFIQLQQLEKQRDVMNEEWGRLLLEQSTLGNPTRVEQQARTRLEMVVPKADNTVVIQR